jgi:anti-sigma factor RsiW
MSQCIQEDTLRAYLDDEMSAAERDAISGHLASCTLCAGKSEILRSEAAVVESLLGSLAPEQALSSAAPALLPVRQRRVTARAGWTAAISIGALAAVMVFAFVLLTRHAPPQTPVMGRNQSAPIPSSTVAVDQPRQAEQLTRAQPENRQHAKQWHADHRPVSYRAADRRPNLSLFIPLDNDGPIESGLIYRVKLPGSFFPSLDPAVISSEISADVIVDGSGRPRAIRFLDF